MHASGFGYRIWTKALPRLNHYRKKGEADVLSTVTDKQLRERILMTVEHSCKS